MAIGVEYDGARYAGWQRQPESPTVQAAVEQALSRVADHPIEVTCGGRTDAGVHALGQVAHFDSPARRDPRSWVLGANTYLPPDIALLWAVETPPDFHARYSALGRTYRYVILNRPSRPAIDRHRVCWTHQPLEAEAMHDAAQCLLGEHDFSAFRAAECQSTTAVRRLDRIAVTRQADRVIMEVSANAFLHHMVRNIAGTLLAVGRGERPASWVAETLAGRDRRFAGVTAPAGGLYFLRIDYPAHFGLPVPAGASWAMIPGA